jgi:hypothetical protein
MFVVGTLKKEQEDTKPEEIGSGERISLAPWHITCATLDNHLGNNAHFNVPFPEAIDCCYMGLSG